MKRGGESEEEKVQLDTGRGKKREQMEKGNGTDEEERLIENRS